MYERRQRSKVVLVADLSPRYGYLRFVEPQFVENFYYMLGDHGSFCPVQFR